MDPMIMRGRIEITGSSIPLGCVLSRLLVLFRPVGSVRIPRTAEANTETPRFDKITIARSPAISPATSRWICPLCPPLRASGKRMGYRWRSSQGANSSANLLRLAGKSRVRASLLCLSVIARVRTSPSLSSDCFFAFGGVYYSVEIHSLHVYLNTRYKHVVNEIEV